MRTRSIVLSLASLSLMASCDHRVFDDLEDQVWVRADVEPSDSPSSGFASGLVPAGGTDLQYFIASKSPPMVFMAKFDQGGSRSPLIDTEIQGVLVNAAPLTDATVMAADTSGFACAGATTGNVAIAVNDGDAPALFMLCGDNGEAKQPIVISGEDAPTGIAFGDTDASMGVDLLAVAGQDLNLIANYQAGSDPGSCSLGADTGDILVADVDAAAGAEVLIAAGGEVQVATGTALATAIADMAQTDCFGVTAAAATITAPGSEASFGTLIRQGDFDGNDSPDLAIAAPADNAVYVFLNWTVAAQSSGTKIDTPAGAASFGLTMATGDFNGDGRDELLISDPGVAVDGHPSAGSVFIYEADAGGDFAAPLVLHDATPEDDQEFGQSLTIVQAFGGARLVVGAKNEVFTYFQTPVSGDIDFRN